MQVMEYYDSDLVLEVTVINLVPFPLRSLGSHITVIMAPQCLQS